MLKAPLNMYDANPE